jgi:hypothetical protein
VKEQKNSNLILIMLFGLVGILLSIGATGEAIASLFEKLKESETENEKYSELAVAHGK